MADLNTVVRNLRNSTDTTRVITNPRAQFGRPSRRYLGARYLPERTVPDNAFREEMIKYRTVIANDGTRYSPVQLKQGMLVGSFEVFLAESDIGSELDAQQYDTLLNYLRRNATMEAVAQLLQWMDTTVNLPLIEVNEKHRWEAIDDALILLRGDNKYAEDVAVSNPAGHRVNAGGTWSNDAYDPLTDIDTQVTLLRDKGFDQFEFITSHKVVGILQKNENVRKRGGLTIVNGSGQIEGITPRLTRQGLNNVFQDDGWPAPITYDLRYRTNTGTVRFKKEDYFTIIARTARDETLDLGDGQEEILPDTLGYVGVGRPAGRSTGGRTTFIEAKDDKPPRVQAQGWQTSLPVITEPEAIAVIKAIA